MSLLSSLVSLLFSTFTISKEGFVYQMRERQRPGETSRWTPYNRGLYISNNMKSVICRNKNGKLVSLRVGAHTDIVIKSRRGRKKFSAYFNTVILKDGKIHGLLSRVLGIPREMDVDDIGTIRIRSLFPRTRKLSQMEAAEFERKTGA